MTEVIHRKNDQGIIAIFCAFVTAFTFLPAASASVTALSPIDPLTQQFAYCAGRASAEFEENFGDMELRDIRDDLRAILESLVPDGEEDRYESFRISAKVAQTHLRHTERFALRQEVSDRAGNIAEKEFRACRGLILGG